MYKEMVQHTCCKVRKNLYHILDTLCTGLFGTALFTIILFNVDVYQTCHGDKFLALGNLSFTALWGVLSDN